MSLSKSRIKHYRSLHQAGGRDQARQFLVEGPLLVGEALREDWPLVEAMVTAEFARRDEGQSLLAELNRAQIPIEGCSSMEMARLAEGKTPQGIVALAKLLESAGVEEISAKLLLICECVSDPGNLGTLLRTADWFGARQVILGSGSADPFSPKVVRATAGSIFRVAVGEVSDLRGLIASEAARGRRLYAATMDGQLSPADLPRGGSRGLVIGHEKRGVNPAIAGTCSDTVRIPGKGKAESLNLAVAAGILLYALSTPAVNSEQ